MFRALVSLGLLAVCKWDVVRAKVNLIVKLDQGELQGEEVTSIVNTKYYSFKGIPYAKPPVGFLRFKDAKPPESWNGIRDATKEGSICTQFNEDNSKYEGSEDCLFLNVHTPRLPEKSLTTLFRSRCEALPVMFWIHGGGFVFGSGNENIYGPDFLVAENVVLVTINYRLSVFGFLDLKKAASGNTGLKDQVLALKWVKKNIAAFCGDPNKVTIFGESSGASSVHWHMMTPMSKGLFRCAISQSAAVLWDQQWMPYETSKNLANAVSCGNRSDQQIVDCLHEIGNIKLVEAAETKAALPRDRHRLLEYTFNPTMEETRVPGIPTFVTDTPERLMMHGCIYDVPYMTGINGEEWMLTAASNKTIFESEANLKQFDSDWRTYIFPETRIPDDSNQVTEAMNDLKKYFMKDKPLNFETLKDYTLMLSDLQIGYSLYYALEYLPKYKKKDLYVYYFTADQDLNFLKKHFDLKYPGASHADELGYLFKVSFLPNVTSNNPAYLTRRRMVRLWTNFAKYCNPTPNDDPVIGKKWKPYTKNEKNYFEINAEVKTGKDLHKERVEFWKNFYDTYDEKGEKGTSPVTCF